ncbi:Tetratricopeptide repeat protein 5 [Glycine soja]
MSNPREEEPLSRAARAAEDLYHLRDTYFPPNPDDRISKLQHESDLALQLLDSIPPEQRKSPMQRATFEYLRGKMLDVFPNYRKEAEDHLSKAVKLNPSLADAWLCLGNCIWKKGDLTAAKNCLSLALGKGPNKKILCQLSMLKRKMSQGAENQAELVEESIQHAKEAITLDEKDESMKSNPDLFFNGATVNKYLENYQRALSGFEAAALKDPGLNAVEEVQKIVNLLDKVDNLLKGHVRAKRMASLASSLVAVDLKSSYRRVTIDLLSEGPNRALAVEGKVFFFVRSESVAPLYYLLCDSNRSCFVLSIYGVRTDVIKEGDQLTLLDPYFRDVDLSWKEKRYQFKSIRLDFYEQVLVNGKALTPQQAIRTSIYAQHKP